MRKVIRFFQKRPAFGFALLGTIGVITLLLPQAFQNQDLAGRQDIQVHSVEDSRGSKVKTQQELLQESLASKVEKEAIEAAIADIEQEANELGSLAEAQLLQSIVHRAGEIENTFFVSDNWKESRSGKERAIASLLRYQSRLQSIVQGKKSKEQLGQILIELIAIKLIISGEAPSIGLDSDAVEILKDGDTVKPPNLLQTYQQFDLLRRKFNHLGTLRGRSSETRIPEEKSDENKPQPQPEKNSD